jgi:hypothetical protein
LAAIAVGAAACGGTQLVPAAAAPGPADCGRAARPAAGGEPRAPGPSAPAGGSVGEAAVAAVGGGVIESIERESDDGAAYEVKVGKPDGSTWIVLLDSSNAVLEISEGSGPD